MWCFNILIFILFVYVDKTSSEAPNKFIKLNNQNIYKDVRKSECIMRLAKKHISCNSVVFVVSSSNHDDFFLRSISEYYCFTIITRSFAARRSLVFPNAYFISAKNITDFLNGLHEISKDLSWNPHAHFIILLRGKLNDITEIFQELINFMIFKVVVLKRTKKDELEAFTYNLQEGNYCSRNASSIRSLGYCPDIDETLFPDKIQDNYGNCTVHVALREEVPYVLYNNTEYVKYLKTGAEQYVLETIAQKLRFNFKYKFISPNEAFGVIFPNRTGTGLLSYLQRHEANVVAGGLFLSGDRLELFDYVYGYSFAIFSVITPTMLEKRWSRVYKQFGVITWFLIIVSFFFMLLVILIIKALTTGKSEDEFLTSLKLWRYFYGQADIGLFKDRYLKRFLIVWIVFTSSIYAFYNTASYSLITAHVQDKIKINYSNIAALPFKPCVSNNTRYYFHSVYNERFPKNDDEYDAQCQNTDMVFNKVAMRSDLYTVEPDYTYYLRAVNYLDSEGQPTINKWDYPRTDILSIYLTKGFPLTKNFQKYAIRIYETGLLQRHLSYIYSRKSKPLPSLKKKYNVIRLEDFKIHYSVLLIGTLISFICFIIELKTGNK